MLQLMWPNRIRYEAMCCWVGFLRGREMGIFHHYSGLLGGQNTAESASSGAPGSLSQLGLRRVRWDLHLAIFGDANAL